jgi:hypothetical protein
LQLLLQLGRLPILLLQALVLFLQLLDELLVEQF